MEKQIEEAANELACKILNEVKFKSASDEIKAIEQVASYILSANNQQSDAVDFTNHLHLEGYEWGNKPHQLYRGGKYFWITDIYTEYQKQKGINHEKEVKQDFCDCDNEMMCTKNCPGREQE